MTAKHLLLLLALSPAANAQVWTSSDPLVPTRGFFGVASWGDLVFAGGGNDTSGAHGAVNIYDASTETWSSASLSEARSAPAATSVDGQVLFAGGATGPQSGQTTNGSATVDIYDVGTNTWSVTTLSIGRIDLSATSVAGYALFGGGRADLPAGGTANTALVDVYHGATGAWSTAQLSVPRRNCVALSVGPYAMFAGGSDGIVHDTIDVYDSNVGSPSDPAAWSVVTMSEERMGFAGTAAGDMAFFAGGTIFGVDTVDVYDASVGPPSDPAAWSVEHLSVGRWAHAATSVGPYALFGGGHTQLTQTVHDVVDVYDTRTGTWSVEHLSIPRRNLRAVSAGGQALFLGGFDSSLTHYPTVDVFTPFLPEAYCGPAIPNSTGAPATIEATGHVLAANDDVTLTARSLPAQSFGYFLNSRTRDHVPGAGGAQGALCLGGSVGRYSAQVQNSGAAGTFSLALDLAATPTPTGLVAIAAGETWNFQAWYRDANPTTTSNFTDALSITFR